MDTQQAARLANHSGSVLTPIPPIRARFAPRLWSVGLLVGLLSLFLTSCDWDPEDPAEVLDSDIISILPQDSMKVTQLFADDSTTATFAIQIPKDAASRVVTVTASSGLFVQPERAATTTVQTNPQGKATVEYKVGDKAERVTLSASIAVKDGEATVTYRDAYDFVLQRALPDQDLRCETPTETITLGDAGVQVTCRLLRKVGKVSQKTPVTLEAKQALDDGTTIAVGRSDTDDLRSGAEGMLSFKYLANTGNVRADRPIELVLSTDADLENECTPKESNTCTATLQLNVKADQIISLVSLNPDPLLANNEDTTTVRVRLPAGETIGEAVALSVESSRGRFIGQSEPGKITVQADFDGVAKAIFRAGTKPGDVVITAERKGFRESILLTLGLSLAETITCTADKLFVPLADNQAVGLTATLARAEATVSQDVPVIMEVTQPDADGKAFLLQTPITSTTKANSQATFSFTANPEVLRPESPITFTLKTRIADGTMIPCVEVREVEGNRILSLERLNNTPLLANGVDTTLIRAKIPRGAAFGKVVTFKVDQEATFVGGNAMLEMQANAEGVAEAILVTGTQAGTVVVTAKIGGHQKQIVLPLELAYPDLMVCSVEPPFVMEGKADSKVAFEAKLRRSSGRGHVSDGLEVTFSAMQNDVDVGRFENGNLTTVERGVATRTFRIDTGDVKSENGAVTLTALSQNDVGEVRFCDEFVEVRQ